MDTPEHTIRKPFVTAILAFFFPGIGYMYVGRMRKGLVILTVLLAVYIGGAQLEFPATFPGLVIWYSVVIALFLFQVIDSERIAKRSKNYLPKIYNRWYWYSIRKIHLIRDV